MEQREFKLETRFSDRSNLRWIASGAAVLFLIVIGLTLWTSLPEKLLPMTDESMSAMIPLGMDGGQPLALKTMSHEVSGHTLKVFGTVENRALDKIRDLLVVIEPTGVSRQPGPTVEAPVDPPELPARRTATFEAVAELDEAPLTYKVTFRIKDGPTLPHKDERPVPPAAPEKTSQ